MAPKRVRETARTAVGESTTLIGETGQQVTRTLVGHVLGLNSLAKLGSAAEYSEDGSLVIHVDGATYEALNLTGGD